MSKLELFLSILFLLIVSYSSYMFIRVLLKMRQGIILPTKIEEAYNIRKNPEKPVHLPTYRMQKVGLIVNAIIIIYVLVMFFLATFLDVFNSSIYIMLILPLLLSYNILNLFAITSDGILTGSRFIPWKRVKSYTFISIDVNHKFYGFSDEANQEYELKITTKGFPTSCIVIDEATKHKLDSVLSEYIKTEPIGTATD